MKLEICSSSMAESSQSGRRRGGGRRPPPKKQPPIGKFHKLGLSVKGFVEAAAGPEGDGSGSGSSGSLQQPAWNGRRSRRDMRREKRKLKRGRRKRLTIVSGEAKRLLPSRAGPVRKGIPPPLEEDREEQEEEVEEEKPPPPPPELQPRAQQPRAAPSATAATRKRALLAANEAEQREIRRLERQLGLHKRRKKQRGGGGQEGEAAAASSSSSLPQSFSRDGLDYVLGALKSEAAFSGLYENGVAGEGEGSGSEEEEEEGLSPVEDGSSGDFSPEEGSESEEGESSQEATGLAGGFSVFKPADLNVEKQSCQAWRRPENPNQVAVKYVPPQMRISEEPVDSKKKEELERLKKTVKGLINRLSESNLASISGQLEELYMTNSRKDMNETLTDILIGACVMESAVPSRLLLEHVLLVGVLHQTVGIEVGAHFLETVVRKFDDVYKSEAEGKECENLLILIANLYNFYVVHSVLIFDILKKLVSTFSGKDIELILVLLKNVGFSLRKEDAIGLRELINEVQKKANAMGKQFQDQSRVCFMLEIMSALKNNDMRKIPGYDPEPTEKLRKLLRTLTHNSSSGKESQLRVSLESLLRADQVGRWWIVGSSWSGAPMIDSTNNKTEQILPVGKVNSKILKLACKQRMNTDIRRNIFCILMTSEDFLDAFEKLLKLKLKDQQEREIAHILLDCCLQEKTYNPFYAYLSAKFCEYEKRFQITFQFSIWDKIRDLGSLSTTAFCNLVKLVTHLLKTKWLSLTVFKVIEFSDLDKPKVNFLRQVLSALFLETEQEVLNHMFEKLADNPKMGMLHEGLKLFLTHFLMKNTQAHPDIKEGALLKEKIDLVTQTLKAKESKVKL
ncbi:nucleolar MIF4G domain-containing protein 1 [Notechis scutatus]|uniref:Nucleolar MIF4G domain-containing protein 1 n=1 Tax=Notechis scutatus TaxID=8663 RepID=A0A6J1V0D0_9SAUR|nr:nucleolar MIF4G domain-containing protein 1 [Notechis scutatus]